MVFEGLMTWQHRFQLLLVENKHHKMFAFPRTHLLLRARFACGEAAPLLNITGGSPLWLLKGCREEGSQALAAGNCGPLLIREEETF